MCIHTSRSRNIHWSPFMLSLGSDSTMHTQTSAASQGCLCHCPASSTCQRRTWVPTRSCIFWMPQESQVSLDNTVQSIQLMACRELLRQTRVPHPGLIRPPLAARSRDALLMRRHVCVVSVWS